MDRGAVSDALSWLSIIWNAPLASRHRGAHRHRAARARHGEFGDFAIRSSASLSCRSAASRTGVFRHQIARLEPGTLGRRLQVDLEDDCSGRPNPFWTLVPRRPSHPQPRPAAPSWPCARLPCAPWCDARQAAPRPVALGAIQSDAAYAVDLRIEGGLAYGGGETERRGVFGNS